MSQIVVDLEKGAPKTALIDFLVNGNYNFKELPVLQPLVLPSDETKEEEEQISPILELPGEIIDIIATHLDIRSLVRLQMTCRGLFPKCLDAQRLKELYFAGIRINYMMEGDEAHSLLVGTEEDAFRLKERQFKATRFRFHADVLDCCSPPEQIHINKAKECLVGRGTVDKLQVLEEEVGDGVDFAFFDQLIQELNMFKLKAENLPEEFWQMPSIKKMKEVKSQNFAAMPLTYLAQTDIENCYLIVAFNASDSSDLNPALKKWVEGQQQIKTWAFILIPFDEQEFFKDFHIISIRDFFNDVPLRRPLVIRLDPVGGVRVYWVKRADDKTLRVKFCDLPLGREGILKLAEVDEGEEIDYEDFLDDSEDELSDFDEEEEEGSDDDGSDES